MPSEAYFTDVLARLLGSTVNVPQEDRGTHRENLLNFRVVIPNQTHCSGSKNLLLGRDGRRLCQAVTNRKSGCRRPIVGSSLVKDACQVIGNRILAQGKLLRDLAVGHPRCDKAEDLNLPS